MRPDTAGGTQPGPMCGSKRFCFMHLAVAAGLFFIHHALAFMFTPAGHAMVATAWAWLKGKFAKTEASTPKETVVSFRKTSHNGDEWELFISSAPLVKQFPAAVGGECPTPRSRRRRAARRLQSSRRMCSRCRSYRSASMRKER